MSDKISDAAGKLMDKDISGPIVEHTVGRVIDNLVDWMFGKLKGSRKNNYK